MKMGKFIEVVYDVLWYHLLLNISMLSLGVVY